MVVARPTPLNRRGGIALAGLLVRAWAAGHIVKNDRLAMRVRTRTPETPLLRLVPDRRGFAIAAHWSCCCS